MRTLPVKKAMQHLKGALIANNAYDMNYLQQYKGNDGPQFMATLAQIAAQLNIDPESLLFVMQKESGLNPAAVNADSGATGLIQFMPSTAAGLGTTSSALASMTGTQQLAYVKQYLQNIKKQYGINLPDVASVYLAIFYPYALTQQMNYVLGSEVSAAYPAIIAAANPGFDIGKKGYITKADMWTYIASQAVQP